MQADPKMLLRRAEAAQAALARFDGRPFVWGREDCLRLLAFVRRKLKRPVSLAKAGSYSSLRGAVASLKRSGFADLESAIDGHGLMRIAPAQALVCDVIGLAPAESGDWVALTVYLGNGRVLGFQGGHGRVLQPTRAALASAIAWRV